MLETIEVPHAALAGYNDKFYGYISVLYFIFPYFDIFKLSN